MTLNRLKDAHRRIMLANHPDRGGSPYLASKVNEAKDLLGASHGSRSSRGHAQLADVLLVRPAEKQMSK